MDHLDSLLPNNTHTDVSSNVQLGLREWGGGSIVVSRTSTDKAKDGLFRL